MEEVTLKHELKRISFTFKYHNRSVV